MRYENTEKGVFLERPNRFIAYVNLNGKTETVHVKNTGRCKELLVDGAEVILQKSDNPLRKTAYDLIGVYKKGTGWINIDSSAPNKVAFEWLKKQGYDCIKPEFTFGKSRVDFYMEQDGDRYLLEIKGCTLEVNGIGYFPDAPTERGVKHLLELAEAAKAGYKCAIGFVIAVNGVTEVLPNNITHPQFGEALDYAAKAGVRIIYYRCKVTEKEIEIIDEEIK